MENMDFPPPTAPSLVFARETYTPYWSDYGDVVDWSDYGCNKESDSTYKQSIGRVSLARENKAGGSWGQEVHILHVNV